MWYGDEITQPQSIQCVDTSKEAGINQTWGNSNSKDYMFQGNSNGSVKVTVMSNRQSSNSTY